MKKKFTNWAKTTSCYPKKYICPKTENEIISLVNHCFSSNSCIKVCGTRHSYNNIFHNADKGYLISLKKFNKIESVDQKNSLVTFQAGAKTPILLMKLKKYGLTIPNLGTNIMDNFIGACSNGYHGSGITYGIQSCMIQSLDLITGTGKKITITKDDPLFKALGVSIGALGIIIRVTIKAEKSFKLKLNTRRINYQDLKENFKDYLTRNKHMKMIWTPHSELYQLWEANETTETQSSLWVKFKAYFWDGIIINSVLHGLLLVIAYFKESFTPTLNLIVSKLLVPKKGEIIFNSYWVYFLPHAIKQDVVEFAFPIEKTFEFLESIQTLIDDGFFIQTPIEVRFVKADNFWLSPAYQRDVCYVGTKVQLLPLLPKPNYEPYFKAFNKLVEKFNGKPHWGKQLYMSESYIKNQYKNWDQFWKCASILDPKKLFTNAFLDNIRLTDDQLQNIVLNSDIENSLKSHKLIHETKQTQI